MEKPSKQTLLNSFGVYMRSAAYLQKHIHTEKGKQMGGQECVSGMDSQVDIARPWKEGG